MSAAVFTFRTELPGWGLRCSLCAVPGFIEATSRGFRQPMEILGMIFGTALWAVFFSWLVSCGLPARGFGLQLALALKRAAWIKFGLSATGWLLVAGASFLKVRVMSLAAIYMIDVWMGLLSLKVVNDAGEFHGIKRIPTADSFGWTILATLLNGALIAIVVGLIALLVLGWWRLRSHSGSVPKMFPVQSADLEVVQPPGPVALSKSRPVPERLPLFYGKQRAVETHMKRVPYIKVACGVLLVALLVCFLLVSLIISFVVRARLRW